MFLLKSAIQIMLAAGAVLAVTTLAPEIARPQETAQKTAQETAKAAPFEADRAGVGRIEDYLNGITTMKADFLQVASTGEVARGTFYLRRPGRLRVEYDKSIPVLIVADGYRLIYFDKELQTVNMVPIDDTLAAFLARPEISFEKDIKVTEYRRESGLIRITLARRGEPGSGSLQLTFDEAPLKLRQWTVTDPQGVRTRVALEDTEWGVKLKDSLFDMPHPKENPFRPE